MWCSSAQCFGIGLVQTFNALAPNCVLGYGGFKINLHLYAVQNVLVYFKT